MLQGYPNLEYIVIDGGSRDSSVDVIREYAPWLAYRVSEPDRGQAHAINRGFARATGEVFGWLNSDDIYMPGTVASIARACRAAPGRIVAGAVLNAIQAGQRTQPTRLYIPQNISLQPMVKFWEHRSVWHQPGILLPAVLWRKVGGSTRACII